MMDNDDVLYVSTNPGLCEIIDLSKQVIFFGSDFHIGHNKDFIYERRGFKNIDDHNEFIYKASLDYVNTFRTLYPNKQMIFIFCGDFSLNLDFDKVINWLNRISSIFDKVFYVFGNHESQINRYVYTQSDRRFPIKIKNVVFYGNELLLKVYETTTPILQNRICNPILCTHYPLASVPGHCGPNSWINICGHTHGTFDPTKLSNKLSLDPVLNFDPKKIPPCFDISVDSCRKFNKGLPIIEFNDLFNLINKK